MRFRHSSCNRQTVPIPAAFAHVNQAHQQIVGNKSLYLLRSPIRCIHTLESGSLRKRGVYVHGVILHLPFQLDLHTGSHARTASRDQHLLWRAAAGARTALGLHPIRAFFHPVAAERRLVVGDQLVRSGDPRRGRSRAGGQGDSGAGGEEGG